MNLQIYLRTWFCGRLVGKDAVGNRYYESRRGRSRRWVLYKRENEASQVPAGWHAWLHYASDTVPQEGAHSWEKPHQPNLTGTSRAYCPKSPAQQRYQSWQP